MLKFKCMEKVILYGGTFDPVTSEHINIIKQLALIEGVKKVIVVPDYQPPHKLNTSTPAFYRKEMLEIALKGVERVEISDFEINQKKAVYSFVTVEHYKKLYPDCELYFAMGTDMLAEFSLWKNPERILQNADIILIERENGGDNKKAIYGFEKKYSKKVFQITYKGKDVSSQEVRLRLYLSLDTEDLLTSEIREYINRKNLYKPNRFYEYINQVLPEKRRKHTLGVILCGKKIAKKLKADQVKTELACLLHDNAKYLDYRRYREFILPDGAPKSVEHQFLGEFIVKRILTVDDEGILKAVKYHTTGRPNMTLLEKIVFTADVIERGRNFEGVEKLRKSVEADFEEGFRDCMCDLYLSLKSDGDVYYLTKQAYDFYK